MPGSRAEVIIKGVEVMVGSGGHIFSGPTGGRVRGGGWGSEGGIGVGRK